MRADDDVEDLAAFKAANANAPPAIRTDWTAPAPAREWLILEWAAFSGLREVRKRPPTPNPRVRGKFTTAYNYLREDTTAIRGGHKKKVEGGPGETPST